MLQALTSFVSLIAITSAQRYLSQPPNGGGGGGNNGGGYLQVMPQPPNNGGGYLQPPNNGGGYPPNGGGGNGQPGPNDVVINVNGAGGKKPKCPKPPCAKGIASIGNLLKGFAALLLLFAIAVYFGFRLSQCPEPPPPCECLPPC